MRPIPCPSYQTDPFILSVVCPAIPLTCPAPRQLHHSIQKRMKKKILSCTHESCRTQPASHLLSNKTCPARRTLQNNGSPVEGVPHPQHPVGLFSLALPIKCVYRYLYCVPLALFAPALLHLPLGPIGILIPSPFVIPHQRSGLRVVIYTPYIRIHTYLHRRGRSSWEKNGRPWFSGCSRLFPWIPCSSVVSICPSVGHSSDLDFHSRHGCEIELRRR